MLDLVLPDMDGVQLIETIRRDTSRRLPVIIHTAKDLSPADEAKLRNLVESFILKGPESHQQLFDETALFLHRAVEQHAAKTSAASSSSRGGASRASPDARC